MDYFIYDNKNNNLYQRERILSIDYHKDIIKIHGGKTIQLSNCFWVMGTELKDKQGKDIYNGDILVCKTSCNYKDAQVLIVDISGGKTEFVDIYNMTRHKSYRINTRGYEVAGNLFLKNSNVNKNILCGLYLGLRESIMKNWKV